jgi:tRNA (adenine37-N6)-methyltransferase
MKIELKPIGYVKNNRSFIEDDDWGEILSEIKLTDDFNASALQGLEDFSHAEIIFYFDKLDDSSIVTGLRHPRNNSEWPLTGIFAQRGRNRPNKLGLTIAKIIEVKERSVILKGLDAINDTPILDIKPVMKEFLPQDKISQPKWTDELMKNYWKINE